MIRCAPTTWWERALTMSMMLHTAGSQVTETGRCCPFGRSLERLSVEPRLRGVVSAWFRCSGWRVPRVLTGDNATNLDDTPISRWREAHHAAELLRAISYGTSDDIVRHSEALSRQLPHARAHICSGARVTCRCGGVLAWHHNTQCSILFSRL